MGFFSWFTGVGVPTAAGSGALIAAAVAYAYLPSVKWLPDIRTPVCVALVALGIWLIAYAQGVSDTRAECNEAGVRAELAAARRDIDTAHEAAAFAAGQSRKLAEAERINKGLADEIADIPDACIADDGHIRRLLRVK